MQAAGAGSPEKQQGTCLLTQAEAILKSGQRYKYAFLLKAHNLLLQAQAALNEHELENYVSDSNCIY